MGGGGGIPSGSQMGMTYKEYLISASLPCQDIQKNNSQSACEKADLISHELPIPPPLFCDVSTLPRRSRPRWSSSPTGVEDWGSVAYLETLTHAAYAYTKEHRPIRRSVQKSRNLSALWDISLCGIKEHRPLRRSVQKCRSPQLC